MDTPDLIALGAAAAVAVAIGCAAPLDAPRRVVLLLAVVVGGLASAGAVLLTRYAIHWLT